MVGRTGTGMAPVFGAISHSRSQSIKPRLAGNGETAAAIVGEQQYRVLLGKEQNRPFFLPEETSFEPSPIGPETGPQINPAG